MRDERQAARVEEAVEQPSQFDVAVRSYSKNRVFSEQQRVILRLHLDGKNDKEIADICHCAPGTVYEHWRRMAKKAGGSLKSEVIADFHRFLSQGWV